MRQHWSGHADRRAGGEVERRRGRDVKPRHDDPRAGAGDDVQHIDRYRHRADSRKASADLRFGDQLAHMEHAGDAEQAGRQRGEPARVSKPSTAPEAAERTAKLPQSIPAQSARPRRA